MVEEEDEGGGVGRWRCGSVGCTQGEWRRLQGSMWREVRGLAEGVAPSARGVKKLFRMAVGSGVEQLEEVVAGLLHSLDTLHLAATNITVFTAMKSCEVARVEEEVAQCLAYLKALKVAEEEAGRVWALVWRVARLQGRLGELAPALLRPSSALLHTWLEVRWALLLLAHRLPTPRVPDPSLVLPAHLAAPPHHHLLLATILDLLHLSSSTTTPTAAQCPCVEELWLGLATLALQQDLDIWELLLTACSIPTCTSSISSPATCPPATATVAEAESSSVLVYPGVVEGGVYSVATSTLAHLVQGSGLHTARHTRAATRAAKRFLKAAFDVHRPPPDEARLRLVLAFVLDLQVPSNDGDCQPCVGSAVDGNDDDGAGGACGAVPIPAPRPPSAPPSTSWASWSTSAWRRRASTPPAGWRARGWRAARPCPPRPRPGCAW